MARIEGIRIQNFRVLRDITLGKLWKLQQANPLSSLTAVIGKNGVGKSTLFDAFGFLADCLTVGVEEACDARGRRGYERIRSQGQTGPIEFEVYYREGEDRPITYELAIDLDEIGRPYVKRERLRQRRKGQTRGRPFSFLILEEGCGVVWKGKAPGKDIDDEAGPPDVFELFRRIDQPQTPQEKEESSETESVELSDRRRLGIATLGALKQHPRIAAFRKFIEAWYLSYFTPDAARELPLSGPQRHLNIHGDNLANVVQFMKREHPDRFGRILRRIADKIPGIQTIEPEQTQDGRLLLKFNDRGFEDPFYSQQMSDGTLKVFAYLLMLEDPNPPPFVCIEEPENGLYHKLLETLAAEFRAHATAKQRKSQIFVTTHQPYFVNALKPEEVWVLEKGDDGFASIRRASDDKTVKNLVDEGLPLGGSGMATIWTRGERVHLEVLAEDVSTKAALDILLPRIIGTDHSFKVRSYRGIGKIPSGMSPKTDASKRILLDQLPRLLRGFGRTFAGYGPGYSAGVVVVCDLDNRCLKEFRAELLAVVQRCRPLPLTRICFAVEELESWLLGDPDAVKLAYPQADEGVLDRYEQDSICGTWEMLADAVHRGRAKALENEPYQIVGTLKSEWAKAITRHIEVARNRSPSLQYLASKLEELTGVA